MAFNAGSIEASLTLNRNAFTAGLKAARAEADKWAKNGIDINVKPNLNRADLDKIKAQIEKVTGNIKVKVSLDNTSLQAVKERINNSVGKMAIKVTLDTTSLQAVKERIDRSVGRMAIKVSLDTTSLEAVKARIERTAGRINVKLGIDAESMAALRARLASIRPEVTVRIKIDPADIEQLRLRLALIRPVVKVKLEYDRSELDRLEGAFRNIGNSGASSFSGMGSQLRVVLALLPLLLAVGGPAITGLIGLVGALGSAFATVGAGLGAFGLVAAGVFKKVTDYAQNAKTAQSGLAAASKAVASAQEGLASAVSSAAKQVEAANRRVGDAERSLTSAQHNAKQAQLALNEARHQAIRDLEDLKLSLRGAALNEEQAMIDLEQAQQRYNQALKDGTKGTELKQLELNVRQAQLAVDESSNSYKNLKEDSAQAAKTGIDGSKGVVSAQERVNDANAAVSDAERNLAEARADAARAQTEANLAIAKAQRELADAQKGYGAALKESVASLSPALMTVYNALESLKKSYDALIKRTEAPVSLAMVTAFKAAETFLGTLDPIVKATADTLTGIGKQIDKYFGGPVWKTFVDFVAQNINPTLSKMSDIIGDSVQGVLNLVMAFNPLAQWMLQKMADGAKDFSQWTQKLGSDPGFQNFLRLAQEALPKIMHFLGGVVLLIMNLSVGLTPFGNVVLDILNKLLDWLNSMDPAVLGAIAVGLASVMSALMLGAGGPVALGIGAIAGLAVIFADLYDKNEAFHKSLDSFVSWIKAEWQPIWDKIKDNFEKYIQPAWDKLVETASKTLPGAFEDLKKAYEEKIKPTFGPLIESLTGPNGLVPAFLDFANVVLPHVVEALTGTVTDLAGIIGGLITIFSGVFTTISGLFTTFSGLFSGDWDKFGKGLKTIAEGFWTIIAGLFGTNLEDLKKQFKTWDDDISKWWADMWGGMVTTQDGKQTEIKGSWATFGSEFETAANTWGTRISNWWSGMWGGLVSDQNGQETVSKGSWATFTSELETAAGVWGTRISNWWNGLWNGISTFFGGLLTTMQTHFGEFGTWFELRAGEIAKKVGDAWKAIYNFFRDPINWVIDVVINKGILGSWNTVMDWISQPHLKADPLAPLPAKFAEGGIVRGPGSGTSDSVPALLSAGEFVVSARQAQQHAHFLAALNSGQAEAVQAAGGPNNRNPYPRFQAGGPVDAGLNFARAQSGKPYVWGGVGPGGYDCSGFMSAIANVLLGRTPYSRIGTTASAPWAGWNPNLTSQFGVGFSHGTGSTPSTTGHMAGTLAGTNVESGSGHGPMTGGIALGAMARQFGGHMSLPQAGGAFVGGGAGLVQQIVSWWSQVGDRATALFNGLLNFAGMPANGSPIGTAITGIPTGLVKKVLGALQTKLEHLFTTITVGGTAHAAGGAGGADVTAAVKAVAARYGWDTGVQWNDLSMLIQKESGWDPTIKNPTSNARGLFQKMTSLYGPLEPTPTGQAEWGLNYIKGRYGDPAGAWAHELKFGWYDKGGMIHPGVSPINTGSHAERILSPQQTEDFHTLVAMLQDLLSPGGLSRGDTYHVMLPVGASVRELANEIDFRKRVSDKGRYRPR
jgi:hypothetical protein